MQIARQILVPLVLLAGCSGNSSGIAPAAVQGDARPFTVQPVADFDEPWAMAFLPDGSHALITEKGGKLKLWRVADNRLTEVSGVPAVSAGGQGGLGDIVLHPNFASNNMVYLSWVVEGEGGRLAVVGRARLNVNADTGVASLENVSPIWRQSEGIARVAISPTASPSAPTASSTSPPVTVRISIRRRIRTAISAASSG